jgi:hypothetical protein
MQSKWKDVDHFIIDEVSFIGQWVFGQPLWNLKKVVLCVMSVKAFKKKYSDKFKRNPGQYTTEKG